MWGVIGYDRVEDWPQKIVLRESRPARMGCNSSALTSIRAPPSEQRTVEEIGRFQMVAPDRLRYGISHCPAMLIVSSSRLKINLTR